MDILNVSTYSATTPSIDPHQSGVRIYTNHCSGGVYGEDVLKFAQDYDRHRFGQMLAEVNLEMYVDFVQYL